MGTLAFNNMSGIGQGGTRVLKVDSKEVAIQSINEKKNKVRTKQIVTQK
jgi:hypothetical protein